ncbi:L-pipecolate oxidase [Nitrincola lacisaponensis]|uniref:L-pipecolate oxidase n=1 Tax=Nitrincola lacisaponensis TaxID=267850 RepID=A0A063XWB3_9GAMM|nr:FAD-binding oxidoreductase [Nitrincola lacisaponensis]KDE38478.1 L-pipecolate oxidase [Nitrincola lacisaponensis]
MLQQCLWRLTSGETVPSLPRLEGERHTEVCVIGGGITGLSCALHLQEYGIKALLLEAAELAEGGSGRNVGLVNAGMWLPPEDICQRLGKDLGDRANQQLAEAPALVFDLIERYRIQCDARRQGTLHLAHNAAGVRSLEQRHAQFQRQGAPVELFQGADAAQLTGSERIPAVLLDRRAGVINPYAYTLGLARAAMAGGAQLYCRSPVISLQREASGWRVQTPTGSVLADQVVLASNAYTEGEWTELTRHFFAGYYYQVASAPLSGAAADAILPGGQGAWDTRKVLSSICRDTDGRLILGSLGSGEHKPVSWLRCWAQRIQRHYFPDLPEVEWQLHWSGRMGFTPDHVMRLFSPAPGLLAASGYNGRGNTTGTLVGKGFAQWLAEGSDRGLPLPLSQPVAISARQLRSVAYEAGFSLYHAGQCLKVLI